LLDRLQEKLASQEAGEHNKVATLQAQVWRLSHLHPFVALTRTAVSRQITSVEQQMVQATRKLAAEEAKHREIEATATRLKAEVGAYRLLFFCVLSSNTSWWHFS
jgi:hypothetical protein